MPRLKRCESGHVFDNEAHSQCPDCARLGLAHVGADEAAEQAASSGSRKSQPLLVAGAIAIPVSWLVGGGAAAALALTLGVIVMFPSPTPAPHTPPRQQSNVTPKQESSLGPRTVDPQPDRPPNVLPPIPGPSPQPDPQITPLIPPPLPGPQALPDPPRPSPNVGPGNPSVPMFDFSKITADKVGAIRNGWGALAFNSRTRSFGESWGYGSAAQAQRRAMSECGEGCESAVWFRGRCGAIVADRSGRWASGLGDTIAIAVRDAYIECARSGAATCDLVRVNCTRG